MSRARLGAPPCSGPDSAPMAAEDGRREVGAGRRDDPCREGRRVEPVVDGQDHVLLDGPGVRRGRFFAGQHAEVVGGEAEIVPSARRGSRPSRSRWAAARMVGTTAQSPSAWSCSSSAPMSWVGCQPSSAPSTDTAVRSTSSGAPMRASAGSRAAQPSRHRAPAAAPRRRRRRRGRGRAARPRNSRCHTSSSDRVARPGRPPSTAGSGRSPPGRARRRPSVSATTTPSSPAGHVPAGLVGRTDAGDAHQVAERDDADQRRRSTTGQVAVVVVT